MVLVVSLVLIHVQLVPSPTLRTLHLLFVANPSFQTHFPMFDNFLFSNSENPDDGRFNWLPPSTSKVSRRLHCWLLFALLYISPFVALWHLDSWASKERRMASTRMASTPSTSKVPYVVYTVDCCLHFLSHGFYISHLFLLLLFDISKKDGIHDSSPIRGSIDLIASALMTRKASNTAQMASTTAHFLSWTASARLC